MKQVLLVLLGLFILAVFVTLPTSSANTDVLEIDLMGRISVFETADNTQTIEEISSPAKAPSFRPIDDNYINLGKNPSLWLRIDLRSVGIKSLSGYLLEIQRNNIIRPAAYYWSKSGVWRQQPLFAKPEHRNRLIAKFPENAEKNFLYIHLNGKYLRSSIKLFSEDGFLHQLQSSALYDGVYYGMLLLFILLNLLLYSRLKIKVYLAYSALLTSIFFLFASGQGWLTFLFPNLFILESITTNSLAMLLALASAVFAKQYLNIGALSPKLNRLLTALQRVVLILLIAKLTLNDYLPQPLYFTAYGAALLAILLIFISCTVAAVIGIQNNQREALYYLWATIVFFVTAIVMGMSAAALIKLKFSWQLLQLASIFEVVIFSLGLFGIYQRQLSEKRRLEEQLNTTQSALVKQLEFSNSLKDTILTNTVEPALFPELAKITPILPQIRYVQSLGNDCLVVYSDNNQKRKLELACNLQDLAQCFGDKHFLRVHKSYLINPQHHFSLKRRTSADYDLALYQDLIPVGRKYAKQVKSQINPVETLPNNDFISTV